MSVASQKLPLCPQCEAPMMLRKGPGYEFYGCTNFPGCRGTRKLGEETKEFERSRYEPIIKMPGTHEQEAFWQHALQEQSHIVVNAGPGVGKTTSAIQLCLRLPKTLRILFVAFNKHIATEASGKLVASKCFNVEASTFHSVGYSILRSHFKGLNSKPNEEKMTEIVEQLCPMPAINRAEWRRMLNATEKLCGFSKNYLLDYQASDYAAHIERIADAHDIDLNGNFNTIMSLLPQALDICKTRAAVCVDFDDMVWLPVVLKIPPRIRYDFMIVDEVQDLNRVQHAMIELLNPKRLLAVGDPRQAIYSFRGAHADSMNYLTAQLAKTSIGVKTFPMTITHRCPKSHVELAKRLYLDIEAREDAPEGEILTMSVEAATGAMRPGDLVLCRVNKELIGVAYALIKRGIRPQIKGREFGKGLLTLLDTLEKEMVKLSLEERKDEIVCLREVLRTYRYTQATKLLEQGDKARGRLGALYEKCDCLLEFINHSKNALEVHERIDNIFSDKNENNVVVLGTIHRTKGLEAARIFILAPELIPHPMARNANEHVQEKNLGWIAATRAKHSPAAPGTLVFCGNVSPIFNPNEEDKTKKENNI